MVVNDGEFPPILAQKHYTQPAAFTPENLLREARRQKQTETGYWLPQPWTTDAPFRETQPAIDTMCKRNLMAVEMEAAALYAFAKVPQKPVLCFAHVTNQMGRVHGDFEMGEADGSHDALQLIAIAADRQRSRLLP
jgi:purine-nucleoside phosphorylase